MLRIINRSSSSVSSRSLSAAATANCFVLPSSLVHSAHQRYHYKSLDETGDPFGEKKGWDGPLHQAQWADIDTEALMAEIEKPEVQRLHFGPDYVRAKILATAAVRRRGPGAFKMNNDDQEASSVSNSSPSPAATSAPAAIVAAASPVVEEKLVNTNRISTSAVQDDASGKAASESADDDTLMTKLTSEELLAAKFIMTSDAKIPSRMVEQEETPASEPLPKAKDLAGFRAPEAMEVPRSIRKQQSNSSNKSNPQSTAAETEGGAALASFSGQPQQKKVEEEEQPPAPIAEVEKQVDRFGLPLTDPLKWDTEEVVLWVQAFGPQNNTLDPDLLDALRLAQANGVVLLNKVVPCDLFKIMRKWHLRRGKSTEHKVPEELVSLTTLQETVILAFPYGGPG